MKTFYQLRKGVKNTLYQNGPQILSGIACAGVITTAILGAKATLKAKSIFDEYDESFKNIDKEIKKELIFEILKIYGLTILSGTVTISCIIASQRLNTKRAAAIATLYSLSKEALETYKLKAIETLGHDTERKIRESVNQEKINKNLPVEGKNVIITSGTVLCYDCQSGRYYRSDYETIRKVINDLNYRLITEMFIELNEFYDELGWPRTKHGDESGWYVDQGLIKMDIDTTMLSENKEPCIVLNYEVQAKATYY